MLNWLRSTFGARRADSTDGFDTLVDATASSIAEGLRRLQSVGLIPFPEMQDDWRSISRQIAEKNAATVFVRPPTAMTWAMIALGDKMIQPFRNAMCLGNRRYADSGLAGMNRIVADAAALAQDEWRIDGVDVALPSGGGALTEGDRVNVALTASGEARSFQLTHMMGFDWSLVARLNESLPENVAGRFAASGGIVVFLAPAQIDALNVLSGFNFSRTPHTGAKVVMQ